MKELLARIDGVDLTRVLGAATILGAIGAFLGYEVSDFLALGHDKAVDVINVGSVGLATITALIERANTAYEKVQGAVARGATMGSIGKSLGG